MGESRPLVARAEPLGAAGPRSRWPADLTARQLLRAADGLEQIAGTCTGLRRQELEREAEDLRRRAWHRAGPQAL